MSGYPGEDGRNGWKAIPGAVLVFSTTTASFSTTYVEDVSRQWRRRSCVGPDHSNASLASVRAFEFEGVRSIDPKRSHSRMFRVSTTFFEWCPCFEAESIEISDRAVFTTNRCQTLSTAPPGQPNLRQTSPSPPKNVAPLVRRRPRKLAKISGKEIGEN